MSSKGLTLATLFVVALATSSTELAAKVGREHSEVERETAGKVYFGCLFTHADRLDDGMSSAEIIGRSVASACRTEMLAYAETFGPFRSKRSKRMFLEMQEVRALETATTVVLETRASQGPR